MTHTTLLTPHGSQTSRPRRQVYGIQHITDVGDVIVRRLNNPADVHILYPGAPHPPAAGGCCVQAGGAVCSE